MPDVKVTSAHLERDAYLYIRQSTARQVIENTESTLRQYALRERAVTYGWPLERVMSGFSGTNYSMGETQRPLLFPQEVMGLDDGTQLLFVEKIPNMIRIGRIPYYDPSNKRIKALFDPDPDHKAPNSSTFARGAPG